jgi:hypothetical protein
MLFQSLNLLWTALPPAAAEPSAEEAAAARLRA